MTPSKLYYGLLLVTTTLVLSTVAQDELVYQTTCSANRKFDASNVDCVACGTNQVTSADGLSCQCAKGFQESYVDGVLTCTQCVGSAPSRDRSVCIPCDGNSGATLDPTTLDCVCPSGFVLVEQDATNNFLTSKVCRACQGTSNTHFVDPSKNAYFCDRCPDLRMNFQATTTSPAGGFCDCTADADGNALELLPEYPHQCFEQDTIQNLRTRYEGYKTIQYDDIVTSGGVGTQRIESATFGNLFLPQAALCQSGNATACQAIANMCVLNHYDQNHQACIFFENTQLAQPLVNYNIRGWKLNMPWLEFPSGTDVNTASNPVDMKLSFSNVGGKVNQLQIVLASYALDGRWLGFVNMTDQLQFCVRDPRGSRAFLDVGHTYENHCYFDVSNIPSADDTVFYDPYLVDFSDNALIPIKLRVSNYRLGGQFPNRDSIGTNDVFFRRFFLYDNVSGRRELGSLPFVIRIAKSFTMTILKDKNRPETILPPIVDIEYTDRYRSDLENANLAAAGKNSFRTDFSPSKETVSTPKVTFDVIYTMDVTDRLQTITLFFIMGLVGTPVYALGRIGVWMRREQSPPVDLGLLGRLFVTICGAFSDLYFWFLYGIAAYWYIFFKGQDTVFVFMPTEADADPFVITLIFCFVAKTIHILDQLRQQVSVDLFFMDWEKSRGKLQGKGNEDGEDVPVSTWRTFMVANEWNEIQTNRVINFEFSIFLLLVFLNGANYIYFARNQPDATTSPGPTHVLLRFAVTTTFWLWIVIAQVIFKYALYYRYWEDQTSQLIDLLSVANVSIFLLDGEFGGYYLHGRSVHTHSDTDMLTMIEDFQREKKNTVSMRGLISDDPTALQTFEMLLKREIREDYNRIFGAHVSNEAIQARQPVGVQRPGLSIEPVRKRQRKIPPTELLKAYHDLNRYLIDYIRSIQDAGGHGTVVEKSFLHKLFHLVPDMTLSNQSRFFRDPNQTWRRVIWHGIEWDLTLYNILTFTFFDYLLENTFIAVIICYIIENALVILRNMFGESNLARKTLVDKRFLI